MSNQLGRFPTDYRDSNVKPAIHLHLLPVNETADFPYRSPYVFMT